MRAMSAALADLLNSGTRWHVADVYELTPAVGAPVRVTSADVDMLFDGHTWRPAVIKRNKVRWALGLEVDTLKLEWTPAAADLVNGVALPKAINAGLLDGARVRVWRIFMATWGDTSAGGVLLFSGRTGQCEADRETCRIPVKSDLELTNIKMPRVSYQPTCAHTVFDAGCGLNGNAWRVATTALSGSNKQQIVTALGEADGYFTLGRVLFSSGANNGLSASIKSHAGGVLTLSAPLVASPLPGDQIFVYPGCDNLESTCLAKFSNKGRFRGWPYVPAPETAL